MVFLDQSDSFRTYARQVTAQVLSIDTLTRFPQCQDWLKSHIADLRDWQIALPLVTCLAVGGSLEDGLIVASAWCPFCLAAVILDDVEDDEFTPDGLVHSAQQATNLSTSLIFLCFERLATLKDPAGAARAGGVFSTQGFNATTGQGLSLVGTSSANLSVRDALESYWREIILKSGSIFKAAVVGGAAAGTADTPTIAALGNYGMALGVMVQLLDDCVDLLKTSDNGAIHTWEVSLPLLLYLLAKGEQRVIFPAVQTRSEWYAHLHEAKVAESFAAILSQWQTRALESIQGLQLSDAERKMLEALPTLILESSIKH